MRTEILQIIGFVCNECIKNSINVLPKISYPFIANMLGKKKDSLRTIFARVKKLGIIDIEAKVKGLGSTVDIIVFENTVYLSGQIIGERCIRRIRLRLAPSSTIAEMLSHNFDGTVST